MIEERIANKTFTLGFYLAVLFQITDFLTFALAVDLIGIHGESNPLMVALYGSLGLFGVALTKLLLIGYLTLILPRLRTLRRVALIATGAIGALGTMTNVLALWLL